MRCFYNELEHLFYKKIIEIGFLIIIKHTKQTLVIGNSNYFFLYNKYLAFSLGKNVLKRRDMVCSIASGERKLLC